MKPIIFSTPMVRAILKGRKTMTRRVLKPQPVFLDEPIIPPGANYATDGCGALVKLPHAVGDVLWVRETFSLRDLGAIDSPCLTEEVWYWADGNPWYGNWTKPKPPIHMPRWAARIFLEVTAVKVERVQEISGDDAWEEGVFWDWDSEDFIDSDGYGPSPAEIGEMAIEKFADLWDSIHGPGAWERNDWVAAYTFKRVEGEA